MNDTQPADQQRQRITIEQRIGVRLLGEIQHGVPLLSAAPRVLPIVPYVDKNAGAFTTPAAPPLANHVRSAQKSLRG